MTVALLNAQPPAHPALLVVPLCILAVALIALPPRARSHVLFDEEPQALAESGRSLQFMTG